MNIRRTALWILVALVAVAIVDWRATFLLAARHQGPMVPWGYQEIIRVKDAGGLVDWVSDQRIDESTPRVSREASLEGSLGAGQVLAIRNDFGSVRLRGVPGEPGQARPGVRMATKVTVYADTEAAAREYLERIDIRLVPLSSGGQGLLVAIDRPAQPSSVRQVKVEIDGTMPSDARVDLHNRFGPVSLSGMRGPSTVRNSFGPTDMSGLAGDWRVEAPYGTLVAEEVAGSLEVRGDYGESVIRDVGGDLTVQGDFRVHRASDVRGRFVGRTRYGALQVSGVEQSVDVDSNYTAVEIQRPGGDVELAASYGAVSVEGARQAVNATLSYADLTLDLAPPLDHRLDVEARYGAITSQIPSGPAVGRESNTQRLEGTVGGGRHPVRVRVDFGDVQIR